MYRISLFLQMSTVQKKSRGVSTPASTLSRWTTLLSVRSRKFTRLNIGLKVFESVIADL